MKNTLFFFLGFLILSRHADCQNRDTINITASTIQTGDIKYGKASYLVYNKKTKESPAEGLYLVNLDVEPIQYKHQPAIAITQEWDGRDTVFHRAYTILNKNDFSTRLHQISWKGLSYSSSYDFDDRKVSFNGSIADSNKAKIAGDFAVAFDHYNLNWHSDLFIFTRLPFEANRSFRINFFDPGFGKPNEEIYSVTGSQALMTTSGKKINCWVLERMGKSAGSYQKFWIDKNSRLVLKEEDIFNNRYRYKLKLEVVENG